MKWVVVSLVVGIIVAVAAYFLLGLLNRPKTKSIEKIKTGPVNKKSEDSELPIIAPQQSHDTERPIPQRAWTGDNK